MHENPNSFEKYIKMPTYKMYNFIKNNQKLFFHLLSFVIAVSIRVKLVLSNIFIVDIHNLQILNSHSVNNINDLLLVKKNPLKQIIYNHTRDNSYEYESINDLFENGKHHEINKVLKSGMNYLLACCGGIKTVEDKTQFKKRFPEFIKIYYGVNLSYRIIDKLYENLLSK